MFFIESRDDSIGKVWVGLNDSVNGLQLFDSDQGDLVTKLKPRGRLNLIIGYGTFTSPQVGSSGEPAGMATAEPVTSIAPDPLPENQMVGFLFQTINPTQVWFASASSPRDEWDLEELPLSTQPWSQPLIQVRNQMIATTAYHQVTSFSPTRLASQAANDPISSKANPAFWSLDQLALGQQAPATLNDPNQLLVIVDGLQLASYQLKSGQRNWVTGLTEFPLSNPLDQTCRVGDCVFATSRGRLKSVNVGDGSVKIDRYLGNISPSWKTTSAYRSRQTSPLKPNEITHQNDRPLIAAWPIDSAVTRRNQVWICDAKTGETIQKLSVDGTPKILRIDVSGTGYLLTHNSLTGLQFVDRLSSHIETN